MKQMHENVVHELFSISFKLRVDQRVTMMIVN